MKYLLQHKRKQLGEIVVLHICLALQVNPPMNCVDWVLDQSGASAVI